VAELETDCCTPEALASCCEAENKAECCGSDHDSGCGCSAGPTETRLATSSATMVRETVREKYAAAARTVAAGAGPTCCSPADEGAYSDPRCTRRPRAPRIQRSMLRSVAASRPLSLTCTRARPFSTSVPARAPTCSSPPAGSVPPARRSAWT
jgi:hypothetical protein